MRDIEKWYMRGLLTLASVFIWAHLFISMVINLFFREAGFLNYQIMPMRYLSRFLEYFNPSEGVFISDSIFFGLMGIIFLITVIGPLRWPRMFIWPVIAVNLFVFVGSIELVWRNFMLSSMHASGPWGQFDEYDWAKIRGFFIFFSALFLALLTPAAINITKQANWYGGLTKVWKNR
ncbi:hypothetical protein MNBD_ALPHA02-80 [hydrothermal vent metagenome]|uniref:Uncharacterized protein n=1 Tax=hydrothermal vent metagenome TaxID=652676 RepID=A0A3B0R8Q4_9ZZZZ